MLPQYETCLLANDCPFLIEVFKDSLSLHFDQVDLAENGQEAIDAVKLQAPDYYKVIVLDISMPIKDGIQACTEIQSYLDEAVNENPLIIDNYVQPQRKPYVYALTSEDDPEQLHRIQRAGFKDTFNLLD
mmetsp:Transcript_33825/g.44677  ORF Transcript_33825/g.44677 Transcript_33825/m.44677 type:complete len:130 (-) Transcript_33825:217-606(-)|eukprot:CAMPEP_0185588490 /NCGR_PEP_ID=MMETSP0434-20130131/53309_1 /TAXON_ID=626734 ORGANISM="Favella taraikaensis, Strain Fe Narragansett Bay" /NCGR_SAMPLE_ID=MMETSP0434 /ASSEMBLY_ACC=CAM_ASM_000379 /LENGTH=129 /DNA_ID=CAMNT_0028211195 /DNA_START=304 /DNA_END=693 /DNA_ORIENTATION=+